MVKGHILPTLKFTLTYITQLHLYFSLLMLYTSIHTVHTVTTTFAAYLPQSTIFGTLDLQVPFTMSVHSSPTLIGMHSVTRDMQTPLNQKFGTIARKELWPMHLKLYIFFPLLSKRGVKRTTQRLQIVRMVNRGCWSLMHTTPQSMTLKQQS